MKTIYSTGTWRHTRRSGLLARAPVEMLSNEPIEYEFACVRPSFPHVGQGCLSRMAGINYRFRGCFLASMPGSFF